MAKTNWGGGLSGAASGASTGAAIGSVIPGIGTAIGGAIGAIGGGLAGLFGSKKKKKRKPISTLDKRQQALNEQQHESILGKGPLADLYNYNPEAANAVFDKTIADPAYRKYKEDLAPSITGQFRSQGLQNSSYVGDALSKTARDIQENLNAQRAQYLYGEQQGARSAKRNAVENLQNRQTFAYDTQAPNPSFNLNSILNSVTPDAVSGLMDMFKGGGSGGGNALAGASGKIF